MNCKEVISRLTIMALFGFNFYSCENDPIGSMSNPDFSKAVNGVLLDFREHPVSGIEIKIGDQTRLTGTDGKFSFNNVTAPYDLSISDDNSKSYYLYKGISSRYVVIPSFYGNSTTSVYASVRVNLPKEILAANVKGKISFSDGEYINVCTDLDQSELSIDLPDRNRKYKGKVVVLTYKTDAAGNISTYENYGESSDIVIDFDSAWQYTYDFTMQQLSLNPAERYIVVNFSNPPGYNSAEGYCYFSFTKKRMLIISNGLKIPVNGDVFNLAVPVNLPLSYDLILGKASTGSGSSFENFAVNRNILYLNFQTKIPPQNISPPDHETGVSGSTVFSFTPGEGIGVNKIVFYNKADDKRYFIAGAMTSISFSEVLALGAGNVSDGNFLWYTSRTGLAIDMDDYMANFRERQDYFGNSSDQRQFTLTK